MENYGIAKNERFRELRTFLNREVLINFRRVDYWPRWSRDELVFFFFFLFFYSPYTYGTRTCVRSFASVPLPRHVRDGDREEKREREEHLERGRFKRARLYHGEKRLKLDPHLRSRASVRDTTWNGSPVAGVWRRGRAKAYPLEGRFCSVFTACRHTWSYTSRLVAVASVCVDRL